MCKNKAKQKKTNVLSYAISKIKQEKRKAKENRKQFKYAHTNAVSSRKGKKQATPDNIQCNNSKIV